MEIWAENGHSRLYENLRLFVLKIKEIIWLLMNDKRDMNILFMKDSSALIVTSTPYEL